MSENKENKDHKIPDNNTIKSSAEAAKILADLGKEALRFGKSNVEITKADQQSSSEYLSSLSETLNAINQEIKDCTDNTEKSSLYKQREDVINRMSEEKENQRQYNDQREDKDRTLSKGIFAVVAATALGVGSIAVKLLIDNKKS